MRRALFFAVPFILFMGLSVLFFSRLGEDPNQLPTALAGKPVPAFSLPLLGGGTMSTADLAGPLLLNVWGTWCPACYEEHPYLLELSRRGVVIVGINYKDDPVAAQAFLGRLGSPYRAVILDTEGKLGVDLGVYGAPETFVIDASGLVRHRITGVVTPENFAREIEPILKETAPEASR